ncbi:unnamed protein product [Phytomonas sp. Hart1]|nr:unnamed protein product [Phytomonas sp. Hart1]|eukprot:CCW69570.1 unnamed protein product [Phytomonas sp. isolate Hart1]
MAGMNLILNITCNPPEISIFGPIKESTIAKLNKKLPNSCSTTNTGKVPFEMVRKEDPPHWYGELRSQFASDDIGKSQLFVTLLDALEEDAAWSLHGTTAMTHDKEKCTYKFFFVRGTH